MVERERLDVARVRIQKGVEVRSGSILGEQCQKSGSQGYDENHGFGEDGAIFRWRSGCVRGSLFLTLLDI